MRKKANDAAAAPERKVDGLTADSPLISVVRLFQWKSAYKDSADQKQHVDVLLSKSESALELVRQACVASGFLAAGKPLSLKAVKDLESSLPPDVVIGDLAGRMAEMPGRAGWYFGKDLANRHGVDRKKLEARLKRHRERNAMASDLDWREVDVERQNEPRFLYRESDVISGIIRDLTA